MSVDTTTTTITDSTATDSIGAYDIDASHTVVGLVARHLVGTKVRGRFTEVEGTITVAEPVEHSSVRATAQAASINTGVAMRDDHLRTNDFLDVATYPTLSFESTRVERADDGQLTVWGDLTVRGVTRNVPFTVEVLGVGPGMQPGTAAVALSATAVIDRRDFGVSFNRALEGGGVVVGNKVTIELDIEAVRAAA